MHNDEIEGDHDIAFRPVCFCVSCNVVDEKACANEDCDFILVC